MSSSSTVHAIAGAGAGLLSLAITYPLYTATVILQSQSSHTHTSESSAQTPTTGAQVPKLDPQQLRALRQASDAAAHSSSQSTSPAASPIASDNYRLIDRPGTPTKASQTDPSEFDFLKTSTSDVKKASSDTVEHVHHQTIVSTLQDLLREHGVKGWYPGLKAALLANTLQSGVFYWAFSLCKNLHNVTVEPGWQMVVGFEAGAANVLLTNPLWVINTRQMTMQKHAHLRKRGMSSADDESDHLTDDQQSQASSWTACAKDIYNKEGIAGFYSGVTAALALTANPAAQFAFYEIMKKWLIRLKIVLAARRGETLSPDAVPGFSTLDVFLLGAAAKLLSTVLTYPMQTLKTQMQKANSEHKTLLQAIVNIWDGGKGAKNFFAGMSSKLVQTTATAAFLFIIYDKLVELVVALFAKYQVSKLIQ